MTRKAQLQVPRGARRAGLDIKGPSWERAPLGRGGKGKDSAALQCESGGRGVGEQSWAGRAYLGSRWHWCREDAAPGEGEPGEARQIRRWGAGGAPGGGPGRLAPAAPLADARDPAAARPGLRSGAGIPTRPRASNY